MRVVYSTFIVRALRRSRERSGCAILGGILFLLAPIAVSAQAQNARPAYDVATIKLATPGEGTSSRGSADQTIYTNQTLKHLVVLANEAQPLQVSGPEWTDSVRFDITAKYPPGTKYHERCLMLRTLLEDRFKLTTHHETREMSGYSLTVSRSGFRLKPSEPGEGSTVGGNQGRAWTFNARKIPMSVLAYELGDSLGGIVVDQTGLDGVYDFQLRWASDDMTTSAATSDPNPAPSIFTAVQDTLGLNLQRQKVPVDVIVIDSAERVPTEN